VTCRSDVRLFLNGDSILKRLDAASVLINWKNKQGIQQAKDFAGFILEIDCDDPPLIFGEATKLAMAWEQHHVYGVPITKEENDEYLGTILDGFGGSKSTTTKTAKRTMHKHEQIWKCHGKDIPTCDGVYFGAFYYLVSLPSDPECGHATVPSCVGKSDRRPRMGKNHVHGIHENQSTNRRADVEASSTREVLGAAATRNRGLVRNYFAHCLAFFRSCFIGD